MRELFRSDYFVVTLDETRRRITRSRTAHPFHSLAEVEAAYEAIIRSLDGLDRAAFDLLVDMQRGPPRNDPDFEQVLRRHYRQIYEGFRQIAIVVKTEAGRLQVLRIARTEGISVHVFVDEPSAIAFLDENQDKWSTPQGKVQ